MDEQNAQTSKQVEEAVAGMSLDKSSESIGSALVTSGSIVDVEEKDSGNEKDISLSEEEMHCSVVSTPDEEYKSFDELLVANERRKSASQGSK